MATDPTERASIPQDMATIGEHYHLKAKLGEGAFGVVYRAHHELLDQDFAIKVLKPELCADENTRQRFLDEARALIRFSHPNVVQVRHVGEHSGQLYLVMDLVRGEPLDEILRREPPFAEKRAVGIMTQVLGGLEAAHAAGIIHRDLKPSNLLVEARADGTDHVRVLDFGLSKLSPLDGGSGGHRSVTGSIIGTLAYMSPEQLDGEGQVDRRSDLFAAGILLQEMLDGHHPYPGESGIMVAAKLLRDPVPPLGPDIEKNVSDATRAALRTALERDPDARHASALAFAEALQGKGPPSDTSRITTIQEARRELARRESQESASTADLNAAKAKKGPPLAMIGLAVLLLGGGAAWWLTRPQDETPKGTAPGSSEVARGEGTLPAAPPEEDTPEPASPGTASPGTATPDATTPDAVTPETVTPETVTPETVTPEAVTPEAVTPDATTPDSTSPEPATPDATTPDATTPDATTPDTTTPDATAPDTTTPDATAPDTATPDTATPDTTTPDTTSPDAVDPVAPPADAMPTTPEACCASAAERLAAGDWAEARTLYRHAIKLKESFLHGLQGTAESYVGEADMMARRGKLAEAIKLLEQGEAFVTAENARHAEKRDALMERALHLGYTRLYRGEMRTERARWLGQQRDAKAREVLASAADDFQFSGQHLLRRGLDDARFRVRRARFHALRGDTKSQLEDLNWITQEANERTIPSSMWTAHVRALRRLAEAGLWQTGSGRSQGAKFAEDGWAKAQKGAAYRESDLTRSEWMQFVRLAWVRSLYQRDGKQLASTAAMLRWWLQLAGKQGAPDYWPKPLVDAQVALGSAMHQYAAGRAARASGKAEEGARLLTTAAESARTAISLQNSAEARVHRLPSPTSYRVLGFVLLELDQRGEAEKAFNLMRQVAPANPD